MVRAALLKSFLENKENADKFRGALEAELSTLMNGISLQVAVPIESRTKEWKSISYAADIEHSDLSDIRDLADFVGLRLIFLLPEEVDQAGRLITEHFNIIRTKDKGNDIRLKEFGYESAQYEIRLKADCINRTPAYVDFATFRAEVRVRTLSQHHWYLASRTFQYDQDAAAPPTPRRSMHRLAALLELVDLELERVQKESATYTARLERSEKGGNNRAESLNRALDVNLLTEILNDHIPAARKLDAEPYADLFRDLQSAKIVTIGDLTRLLDKYLPKALENDALSLELARKGDPRFSGDREKMAKGYFYGHVGLVRNMLTEASGKLWQQIATIQ